MYPFMTSKLRFGDGLLGLWFGLLCLCGPNLSGRGGIKPESIPSDKNWPSDVAKIPKIKKKTSLTIMLRRIALN